MQKKAASWTGGPLEAHCAVSVPCPLAVYALPPAVDEAAADGVCNSADALAPSLAAGSKLVWHVRHGQSTGNAARAAGVAGYARDEAYADTPLSELGERQARDGAAAIAAQWGAARPPTLIVCSPLTRAIQTAALMFGGLLGSGAAALVLRPEIREYWHDNVENRGRALAELRRCPRLRRLPCWEAAVAPALAAAAAAEWGAAWDGGQAAGGGGAWEAHCASGERTEAFRQWLAQQPAQRIAVVSHWGALNNLLNREPWAERRRKRTVGANWHPASWPDGRVAQLFSVPNCGWVCLEHSRAAAPATASPSQ